MDKHKILEEIVDGLERTALVTGIILLPGVEVPFQYLMGREAADGYPTKEIVSMIPLSIWYGGRNLLYTAPFVSEHTALTIAGATLGIEALSYAAGYFQFKSQTHKQKCLQS